MVDIIKKITSVENLKRNYLPDKLKELMKELGIANVHQIPKIEKIVLNSGVGKAVADSKHMDLVVATLTKISGQQPITTKAQHSIASFKLREGMVIGAKVTLRGEQMYSFLDRLVSIVLPRVRDFHGVSGLVNAEMKTVVGAQITAHIVGQHGQLHVFID